MPSGNLPSAFSQNIVGPVKIGFIKPASFGAIARRLVALKAKAPVLIVTPAHMSELEQSAHRFFKKLYGKLSLEPNHSLLSTAVQKQAKPRASLFCIDDITEVLTVVEGPEHTGDYILVYR